MCEKKPACRNCGSPNMRRTDVYTADYESGLEEWTCDDCNSAFEVEVFYDLVPGSFGRIRTMYEVDHDIYPDEEEEEGQD